MKQSDPAGSRLDATTHDRRTVLLGGLALVGVVGLSACTSGPGSNGNVTPSSEPTPTPSAADTELGAKITAIVEPLLDTLLVPGVVVTVRTPQEEWRQAFGRRALAPDSAPVTVDDHFRIGSNTKTMTGTCVLQLVDEGTVDLDDHVQQHSRSSPTTSCEGSPSLSCWT